jgi:putative thioredoxin
MLDNALVPAADLIKEGSDAAFVADVIEESRKQPVIVDFWAPWCGPCRQLTPTIEKVVREAGGAVKLVKIDIDKNPHIAGQLGVKSIPAVYGFVDGKPADGFMGAQPEGQVKAFVQRLANAMAGNNGLDDGLEELLALAGESVAMGDMGGAAQAFAQVLQANPENVKALSGLARVYLSSGDVEQARQLLSMAPADSKDPDLVAARAAVELAAEGDVETAALEQTLAKNPGDHATRFELAKALAGQGDFAGAADHQLKIIEQELDWNEQAARHQLLKVFEAAGPASDVAKTGRRRLSTLLFS